jgi:hypothetical protein
MVGVNYHRGQTYFARFANTHNFLGLLGVRMERTSPEGEVRISFVNQARNDFKCTGKERAGVSRFGI